MESSSYQAGVIQRSLADCPQFLVSHPASQLPFRTPAQVHVDPTIVKEYNFYKFFRLRFFQFHRACNQLHAQSSMPQADKTSLFASVTGAKF